MNELLTQNDSATQENKLKESSLAIPLIIAAALLRGEQPTGILPDLGSGVTQPNPTLECDCGDGPGSL